MIDYLIVITFIGSIISVIVAYFSAFSGAYIISGVSLILGTVFCIVLVTSLILSLFT